MPEEDQCHDFPPAVAAVEASDAARPPSYAKYAIRLSTATREAVDADSPELVRSP